VPASPAQNVATDIQLLQGAGELSLPILEVLQPQMVAECSLRAKAAAGCLVGLYVPRLVVHQQPWEGEASLA
jgi:hypothetical protein